MAAAQKINELQSAQGVLVDNLDLLHRGASQLSLKLDALENDYVLKLAQANAMATQWATEAFGVREAAIIAAIRVLAHNFMQVGGAFEMYRNLIRRWRSVSHSEVIAQMLSSGGRSTPSNPDRYTAVVLQHSEQSWQQRLRAGTCFLREVVWNIVLGNVRAMIVVWHSRMAKTCVILRSPEGGTVTMKRAVYHLALLVFQKLPSQRDKLISGLLGNWRSSALFASGLRGPSRATTATRFPGNFSNDAHQLRNMCMREPRHRFIQ